MEFNGIKNDMISPEVYKNLPNMLQQLTQDFAEREKDIVLLSSIGVLSNCLPKVWGIYDGDKVFSNLYVLIVAPPASGKGVMKYSRRLIKPIHEKIFEESKAELLLCQDENKKNMRKKGAAINTCPPMEVKILPANISTAEMYSYLGSSKYGTLIFESEADTMGNMFSNDWSNYSDVLRKAFHHEPLSISRKMEKVYEDIQNPRLSIVISGTPSQMKPLINSKDNGLFSRFLYYTFDDIASFKNVFSPSSKRKGDVFNTMSSKVFELYESLVELNEPVEFELTESQQFSLVQRFTEVQNIILENHSSSFLSSLKRHGLLLFKISMILTVLRQKKPSNTRLICEDVDFENAMEITLALLRHAFIVFNNFEDGGLSKTDEEFLFSLDNTFIRKQAVEVGKKFGIPERTVDDKLKQLQRKKTIVRLGQGKYRRTLK